MEQRKEFLEAAMRGEHSFTELCRRFGISRKNGYKWLNRYRIELAFPDGTMSFDDRSRRPHNSPTAISTDVEVAIVELRKRRPHWGAQETASGPRERESRSRITVGEHVRSGAEAKRLGQASSEASEEHAVHRTARPRPTSERCLGDRLQGGFRRRAYAVLPAHDHRLVPSIRHRVRCTHQHADGHGQACSPACLRRIRAT